MVKLPDVNSLSGPGPRAVGLTPNFPNIPKGDPAAAALQGLGQTVQGLGSTLMARAEEQKAKQLQAERFNQTNRLLQFEQEWNNHVDERRQTVEPGAVGYSAGLEKDFTEQARAFMKDVPPELRPEIDQRLQRERIQRVGDAKAFEQGEAKRYSVEQAIDSESTLLSRGKQDPSKWREVEAQGAQLWDDNPNVDNIERHQLKQKWQERRAEAELEQLPPHEAREALMPQGSNSFVEKVVGVESRGNPNAKNQKSTATGAGQFIEGTWRKFIAARHPELLSEPDVLGLRNDPALSREAVAWYAHENGKYLASKGLPANDATLYLAHFAGPDGAAKILMASTDTPIESVLTAGQIKANPFLKGKTAGEVAQWAKGKMGPGSTLADSAIDPRFAALSYEKREQLIKSADAAIERDKREYLTDIDDYVGFLRSGNPEVEAGRYSAEDLVANLGEKDAAIEQEKIQQAESFGADVKKVKWATIPEVQAIVDERRAMLDSPEDFAQNAQDLNGLGMVLEQRFKALADDPAAYVREEPTVKRAYEALQAADEVGHSTAARAYANASMALQERLGVSKSEQRILSNADVAEIAARFSEQPEGGQNAAGLMGALETKWGSHWPQVFGELTEHGKLPGPAMVVGTMNLPEQARAAEQLAEASKTGRKLLEEALPEETVKKIKEEMEETHSTLYYGVGSQLQEFRATLRHMPGGAAEHTYGTFKEAIHLLALSYAGQGETPEAAATRAYADIIGKAYNIVGSFRVPTEYDSDAVEAGSQRVLADLDPASIAVDRRVQSLVGLPEDEIRDAFISHLQSYGRWVTSSDETGLSLLTGDQRMVTTHDGAPLVVTWEELQGPTMASQPFIMVPGWGPIPNFLD